MRQLKDAYQDIQPVTLRLPEERATSSLYCSTAEGMEARVSTLVEAFLVEVYRCRVCQFTSSLKAKISTHVAERHDLGHPCHALPCLEKDDRESLDVEVRVAEEELDRSRSPYDLEDALHAATKDREDHIDHMGLERMSFLLPMYGILHNISPQSCDMSPGTNSDGGLHVAHTCEVSTLFEEEENEEEEEGEQGEEVAEFRLEDTGSVDLPGTLSCPMESVGPEDQNEEMAQSAHLMSLGLCRISSIKCLPPVGTPEPRSSSALLGQEGSDNPLDEKSSRQVLSEMGKPTQAGGLSCILCHADLFSQSALELHLKCHGGVRGFKCPQCGWATEDWTEMESHCRGHGTRCGSRPHQCGMCPRAFRSVGSRDAHRRRHGRQGQAVAQCVRCLAWFCSKQESELHRRCHFQGGFKCLVCSFTDKSWDEIHKHMLSQHKPLEDLQDNMDQQSTGDRPSLKEELSHLCDVSADHGVLPGADLGSDEWWEPKKRRKKKRVRRRTKVCRQGGVEVGQAEAEAPSRRRKKPARREFCCPLCDRKFTTKLTMRRHMGIHQGEKPFQCPQCPYSTRLKASLVQHLRVHTGEKPFRCSQCPYASIDGSSLRRHSRTHTQEKPHRCQHCPYSSIQKKSLDLHMRRHHTGESFPCHLCHYSTPDRQLLLRHLHKHHATDPSLLPRRRSRPRAFALSPLRHTEAQNT